jgi:endoglucanase
VLSKLPNATIYLEGEAADWEPARIVASKLRRIGIAKVRGFMLNATHYEWTAASIRFGLQVSRMTGGKHFVINTAENGRGPVHYRKWIDRSNHIWRTINVWCNPGLRGLGPPPTTDTSRPDKVDAYLWINRPGYAQSCQGRKIDWFLPRALSYARYATDWESPPRGTRFGHFERHPLSAFGVPR